ncbi:hypothetical protein ACPXB5_26810 [Micromonospora arida]|uniref:Uncharacterized protein n=1 Tax=Micromonospora zamorensis TaxID=709883 RepID=A0ABZ1PHS5_9ACTN
MAELGWAQLALVVWLATGLVTAAVFVTRGGHRNLLWYLVGGLLGPLFVPIAVGSSGRPRSRPTSASGRRHPPGSACACWSDWAAHPTSTGRCAPSPTR